jgi:ElaB/YqjD/DUF883 family membrane-anchored ribosome-binding protein
MNNGTIGSMQSDVEEKVNSLKDRVIEAKTQVVDRGNAMLDKSTSLIKDHPIKSVAIAFGVGYLAMRLFR